MAYSRKNLKSVSLALALTLSFIGSVKAEENTTTKAKGTPRVYFSVDDMLKGELDPIHYTTKGCEPIVDSSNLKVMMQVRSYRSGIDGTAYVDQCKPNVKAGIEDLTRKYCPPFYYENHAYERSSYGYKHPISGLITDSVSCNYIEGKDNELKIVKSAKNCPINFNLSEMIAYPQERQAMIEEDGNYFPATECMISDDIVKLSKERCSEDYNLPQYNKKLAQYRISGDFPNLGEKDVVACRPLADDPTSIFPGANTISAFKASLSQSDKTGDFVVFSDEDCISKISHNKELFFSNPTYKIYFIRKENEKLYSKELSSCIANPNIVYPHFIVPAGYENDDDKRLSYGLIQPRYSVNKKWYDAGDKVRDGSKKSYELIAETSQETGKMHEVLCYKFYYTSIMGTYIRADGSTVKLYKGPGEVRIDASACKAK